MTALPTVTLVGMDPGDPDLLTSKAVKALRRATVELVDDLVHPGVLRHLRHSARVVHVGKRGGWAMAIVDFLRGVIRPVGTAYLMVVTTSMFWWTTRLAEEYGVRMSADQVLTLQRTMIETVSYCAVTSWVWWFGVRSGQPPKR